MLATYQNAYEFLGETFGDLVVTHEVAGFVQIYLDLCTMLQDACDKVMIEHKFDLAPLNPPAPMFGSADFVAYSAKRRALHVVDYKNGSGHWVPAKHNDQLMYYALGASLAITEPVSNVSVYIVQPRFQGNSDPVRSWSFPVEYLAEWSVHLMARAREALRPTAPTVPGDWCRFCPVRNSCLAYQNQKAIAAFRDFTLADAQ